MKQTIIRSLLAGLAGISLHVANVQAQELPPLPHLALARLDIPVDWPGLPAYARLGRNGDSWGIPRDAEWSAIVFYRDPECIPIDFDLSLGFDPPGPQGLGAWGCRPLFEGSELRFSSLELAAPPEYIYMRNATLDLPIWFVATQELNELLDRGFVYIDEIEALSSRVVGHAWQFEEQITPLQTTLESTVRMSASGRLESGGRFSFVWFYMIARDPVDFSPTAELENIFELQADLPSLTPPPPAHPPHLLCLIHPHLPMCRP